MSIRLRVLILEDRPDDAALILHELRRAGFEPDWQRVETEPDYRAALDPALDVILADYALPQFDGLRALQLLRERGWDIPFILVSGVIGEEQAVAALKQGAADYLLKDRLARLGPAVTHALQEARLREEKRQAEAALRASEQYARSIIDSSLDMIITVDNERRIVEFNRAAQETFGYTREEVMGKQVSILYADPQEGQTVHQTIFEDGKVVREILNRRKNGETFPSFLSASVMQDANGELLGIVEVSRDITERKQAEEKLRYLSMHDALTGLYNRTYFEEEMARLERGREFPASVVMTDIDGLKKTNDHLGHPAGDDLLRQAAAILSATFRAEDVIARIGGDEFAVLLPDTGFSVTQQVVERLRNNLANHNATHSGPPLSLSIGAATADKGCLLADALKQADEHMYREKNHVRGVP
jgi:diguanylate cyclase (GGDEF)-like protein/PAS domain S-box-containing protein